MAKPLEKRNNKSGAYHSSDGSEWADYEQYVRYEEMIRKRDGGVGKLWMWMLIPALVVLFFWFK